MTDLQILDSLRFVGDKDGRPAAVQLSIQDWEALVDYLDDLEDHTFIKEILPRLQKGPERSMALDWARVKEEWDT